MRTSETFLFIYFRIARSGNVMYNKISKNDRRFSP